jgi:phosphatidylglycerophosphatase A
VAKRAERLPRPDLGRPVQLLAFGFGAGCAPRAPGTVGTLLAVALYLPLSRLPLAWYSLLVVIMVLGGVWLCGRASSQLGVHDHPGIVWDEFAGLFITLWMAPDGLAWVAAGFLLFRLFDILKPWPIGWLDRRVRGGLGIMLDDVVAGLFAWVCLQTAAHLL